MSSVRGTPIKSYDEPKEKIPPGVPERGEDEHPNRTDSMVLDQGNGQTNTSKQCTCGKICKNERGLKIHQGKMKCLVGTGPTQRTGVQPGETQEEPGPETTHRTSKCCN